MNVLFVLAHPEPTSFNARLVELGKSAFENAGGSVRISDLYAQGFDPVERAEHYVDRFEPTTFSPLAEQRHAFKTGTLASDVQAEIEKLEWADLVIFQFPIWWHTIPAILKGWMDRVFVSGGLYTSKMRYDQGYFRGKRAMCSITSGAPAEAFVSGGRGGELSEILWSAQFSLYYMGFDVLSPHASFGVAGHGFSYVGDDEFALQFSALEDEWLHRLAHIASDKPLVFPGWDDWDELGQPRSNIITTASNKKDNCNA